MVALEAAIIGIEVEDGDLRTTMTVQNESISSQPILIVSMPQV